MTGGPERHWHRIVSAPMTRGTETVAEVRLDEDSAWFDGHFPEMPVLPGIAQLAMATEVIAAAAGSAVRVTGIRRIRFKRKIGPGEPITVGVSPLAASGQFTFRILAGDAVACTGTMTIETGGPDGR